MSYRIVIVTGDSRIVQPVEQHLQSLQWDVFVTENFRVAISEAEKRSADFVLIAADHPSRWVRNLPKLLRKACKARLVGYVETNTRTSINTLSEMHFEHVVKPPFSGEGVETVIKEIIRNDFESHGREVARAMARGSLVSGRADEELLQDIREAIEHPLNLKPALTEIAELPRLRSNVVFKKDPAFLPDQKSRLAQLTQQALDDSVSTVADEAMYESLGIAKRFACLFVHSSRFSGYLIAALGQNRAVDVDLMNEIKARLFENLRTEGNQIFDADPIQIDLHEVSIEDWAFQDARFLAKSVHDAKEIAVAFFENDSPLEPSEIPAMMKIKVAEIHDQVELEFDVFVHLPRNNRMLKYSAKGWRFAKERRMRLMLRGVSHLHLRSDDFAQAFHFVVKSKLNQKIHRFHTAAAAPA